MTIFAAAAMRTRHVALGTSIVPIYSRHPLTLAAQALVLADLAPGRLRLGIGPSHQPMVEGVLGLPFVHPLAYMREYVTVLRQYLWTGQAKLAGDFFTVDVAMPPAVRPPQTPLLLAALRSNAFRLAGELSDGAISWMCPVPYLVSTALPALSAGADAARRPRPPLVAHVPVALSQDREAVHVAARARLGLYGHLPFYARMFADAGLPPTAEGMLTDALIDEVVVSGTGDQVASRLRAILAAGIDEILAMPVPVTDGEAEEAALLEILATIESV